MHEAQASMDKYIPMLGAIQDAGALALDGFLYTISEGKFECTVIKAE